MPDDVAATASQGPAIAVRALCKSFGETRAVDGVSFAVEQGEIFGIVGPNGAGKTTTLEMIEGLRRPDSGEIEVLGVPVWPHPARVQRTIGVQLQATALFDFLSARELLALFARFYGPVAPGQVQRALATVGLEEKAGAWANTLSGGQQQRLAIALALVHRPDIVFLDEPTTGLDPQARRNLWDVIRAIGEDGHTVVLTTHYMEEAEVLCRRVAIVDTGRIVALDTPARLIGSLGGGRRVVFAGTGLAERDLAALAGVSATSRTNGTAELLSGDVQATLNDLLALAARTGVSLADLAVERPTLEDVFLQLTGREYRQ